jgi:hypothetical protein
MITKFIITTTGVAPTVKLEGVGSYHYHPETSIDLMERFEIDELVEDTTIQDAIDNGEITVVDQNGDSIVNMSYILLGPPIIDTDNYDINSTYIGYGDPLACNILRVITTNNTTYTQSWADSSQNFDKIWADRGTYTYL